MYWDGSRSAIPILLETHLGTLIRIVTRLGSFEGRFRFATRANTLATRSLLRTKKRLVEASVQGAKQAAAFFDAGVGDIDPTMKEAEYRLLCEEVRCGRQVASSVRFSILDPANLPLAEHARYEVRVWIEPVAKQLVDVVTIGDLYRSNRFIAPAALWDELQERFPELLDAG